MSTASDRRAAYRRIATLVGQHVLESDSYRDTVGVWFSDGERAELIRIRDAMDAAGAVVDEPGVEAHTSGNGKP